MKLYHSEQFDRHIMKVVFIGGADNTFRSVFNFVTGTETVLSPGAVFPRECIMEIPIPLWEDMLKQFAELASEKGIKLDSDLKREGTLEATERHLQDMRAIVFKTKTKK